MKIGNARSHKLSTNAMSALYGIHGRQGMLEQIFTSINALIWQHGMLDQKHKSTNGMSALYWDREC